MLTTKVRIVLGLAWMHHRDISISFAIKGRTQRMKAGRGVVGEVVLPIYMSIDRAFLYIFFSNKLITRMNLR